jgi:hypothetical protein
VSVGGVNMTKNEIGESHSTVKTFTSTKAIYHENYDDRILINDIAIIINVDIIPLIFGIG